MRSYSHKKISRCRWAQNEAAQYYRLSEVAGRCVIGTLPPALIQHCAAYIAVTIDGYDRVCDGDLAGYALLSRMHVSAPIKVAIS